MMTLREWFVTDYPLVTRLARPEMSQAPTAELVLGSGLRLVR